MTPVQAVQFVASFYRQMFESTAAAQDYVLKRGVSMDTARAFDMGYAPVGNKLAQMVESTGNSELKDHLLNLEILKIGQDNKVYDFYRNRIIIPIRDTLAQDAPIVGFGGRAISVSETVKYLNSAESILFKKSDLLFNYQDDKASKTLCMEGYFDVISAYQNGFQNSFAALGTAINEEQLQRVLHTSQELVLVFDGDKAGVKAAKRTALLALPIVDDPGRIKVCVLPNNEDPDSFLKNHGKAAFDRELNKSINVVDFLISQYDLAHIDTQVKLISDMKGIIKSSANNVITEISIMNALVAANNTFSIDVLSKMLCCSPVSLNQCKQTHRNRFLSL